VYLGGGVQLLNRGFFNGGKQGQQVAQGGAGLLGSTAIGHVKGEGGAFEITR